MDNLQTPQEGQPVSAGWLAGLLALVRRQRVTVEAGSGLTFRDSPAGTVVGFVMPPVCYYMEVTTQVEKATEAGPGKGKGKGKYVATRYVADDVAKWDEPAGAETPLYSMDTANPTPAGKRVIVALIAGRPHIIVELC